MPVTNEQVATLRAQLAGDLEEHTRLLDRLDREADRTGYAALVTAGFCSAVERRFANKGSTAGVVEWVADLRTRGEGLAEEIDPSAAERMILAVYTDADIDDLDSSRVVQMQILLLAGLVGDEQFNGTELDAFLVKARKLADQILG